MGIQPGVGYTFNASSQGSNLTIEKPWAPWANYNLNDEPPGHPFKIVNVQIASSGGSNVIRFQVQSGTINNIVPVLDDYVSDSLVKLDRVTSGVANPPTAQLETAQYNSTTKTSYIYLRSGPDATTKVYPATSVSSARYPAVGGYNDENAPDTDEYGYLKIGTITVDSVSNPTTFTVIQNVTGSLWADRIKMGEETAAYYYARI